MRQCIYKGDYKYGANFAEIGHSNAIRLPKKVIDELQWQVNQEIDFSVTEKGLVLKPAEKPSIKGFLMVLKDELTKKNLIGVNQKG
ncbi:AbrB/MazE/SpoVT family DNA-binding domain-containing protein [Streptococcus phocae subsp. salmonis]|uniref:AbrB/MazE/SpoVT family DNA-binding domain-containing protein n=1 Tax=Streptococcus phocae TaxID=119224 RepID=UPI0005315E29|nr:AbrB/MazE/SpoVT family DNA-binding domain-containing protein [Streptococcus phocae]KGR72098.1 hypothetical protein NX86_08225 [Streptococcus phocae subsp. salmonis]